MQFTIHSQKRRFVLVLGLSGGMALLAMFALFHMWSPRLDIDEAKQRVRQCIQREIAQRHMAELKERQLSVPDMAMAIEWKKEIDQAKKLEFVEVDIERLIPDILFHPHAPSYVVKVVFRGENHARYYFVSWDRFDRQTSKLAWYFSM